MEVDMKETEMRKLVFKKTRDRVASFCERCGSVCDSVCRAAAVREHARMRALAYGWRQV